jgi:hypothetical protein
VQNERARIHIPENRNFVPHEIILRGLTRAPIGCDPGKFPDDQGLDVGDRRFFVIGVRPDISNVWIGQADNLSRVAWIGEDFLVTGEARIENDFAAAPGDGPRGAAIKNAPVFERKNSLWRFCQWTVSLCLSLRRPSAMADEADYFTDSAKTGIEPK